MGGEQLRVRETRNFGSVAKYAGVDLGREQGTGRGEVVASFFRVTAEGRYECFTFLPDTIHNRLMLLQRQVELAEWDGVEWVLVGKDSVDGYLAPAKPRFNALAITAAVDGVELQGSGPNVELPGPVVISGLEDFLGLSKDAQLEVLAREDFAAEALQEVLECKDSRLSLKVRNAAIRKAERIVEAQPST